MIFQNIVFSLEMTTSRPTAMSKMWFPRAISCSAGGLRALSQLGTLAALRDAGVLNHVHDWYGCSGGGITALIGTLYVLGATSAWIRDALAIFDTTPFATLDTQRIAQFWTEWGILSGSDIIAVVGRILNTLAPTISTWTFRELEQHTGSRLHLIATNVSRCCSTTFSSATTPHVRVLDALQASMAVPSIFVPVVINGDLYCDGAVDEYYPWMCVEKKDETLVLLTDSTKNMTSTVQSFAEYLHRIYSIMYNRRRIVPLPRNWIAVNEQRISMVSMILTLEDRMALFADGIKSAKGWLLLRKQRHFRRIRRPVSAPVAPLAPLERKTLRRWSI